MEVVVPLNYNEDEFIAACQRREEWALKRVYEENFSILMSVCMRFASNTEDALDLLHEGFLKVIKNIDKYQQSSSLSSWLRRVMVNSCIDNYRKEVRRRTDDLEQVYTLQTLDPDAVSSYTEQEILLCIQQLTPSYRAIFVLYAIEGYSHKEIANQLGITESTSRSNLVKARYKLQELLQNLNLR
jgi:RNA polymerase sigma-70 factor (ECF subfamily)